MPSKIKFLVVMGAVMVSLAVVLTAGNASAGWNHRKHAATVPPNPAPYAPYYYSRWNPYSLYSVYDHLSGGRQLCYLPTEP